MSDTKPSDTTDKAIIQPASGKDEAEARQRLSDQAVDPRAGQDQLNRNRLRDVCAQEAKGASEILINASSTMSAVNEAVLRGGSAKPGSADEKNIITIAKVEESLKGGPAKPGTEEYNKAFLTAFMDAVVKGANIKPGSEEQKIAITAAEVAYLDAINKADARLYMINANDGSIQIDQATGRPVESTFLKDVRKEKGTVAKEIDELKQIKPEGRPLTKAEMDRYGASNSDSAALLLSRQNGFNVLNDVTRRSGYATANYGLALERASVGLTDQDKLAQIQRGEYFVSRAAYLDNQMLADVKFQVVNDKVRAEAGLPKQELPQQGPVAEVNNDGKAIDGTFYTGNARLPSGEIRVDAPGFVSPLPLLKSTETSLTSPMSQANRDGYIAALKAADSINRPDLVEKMAVENAYIEALAKTEKGRRIGSLVSELDKFNDGIQKSAKPAASYFQETLKGDADKGFAARLNDIDKINTSIEKRRATMAALMPKILAEFKQRDLPQPGQPPKESTEQQNRVFLNKLGNQKDVNQFLLSIEKKPGVEQTPAQIQDQKCLTALLSIAEGTPFLNELKNYQNEEKILETARQQVNQVITGEINKLDAGYYPTVRAYKQHIELYNSSETVRLSLLKALGADKDKDDAGNKELAKAMQLQLAAINPERFAKPVDATTVKDGAAAAPVSTLDAASVSSIGRAVAAYDVAKGKPGVPLDQVKIQIDATRTISANEVFKQAVADASRINPKEVEGELDRLVDELGRRGWTKELETKFQKELEPEFLALDAKRRAEFAKIPNVTDPTKPTEPSKQTVVGDFLDKIDQIRGDDPAAPQKMKDLEAGLAALGATDPTVKTFLDAREEAKKFFQRNPLVADRLQYAAAEPSLKDLQHAKAIAEGLYGAALLNAGDKAGALPFLVAAARDKYADETSTVIKAAIDQHGRAAILAEAQKPVAVKSADATTPLEAPVKDQSVGVAQDPALFESALNAQETARLALAQVKPDGNPLSPELAKKFTDAIAINSKIDIKALETTRAALEKRLLTGETAEQKAEYVAANQAALLAQSNIAIQIKAALDSIGPEVPAADRPAVLNQRLTAMAKEIPAIQTYLDALNKATAHGVQQSALAAEKAVEVQIKAARDSIGADVPDADKPAVLNQKLIEAGKKDPAVQLYLDAVYKADRYTKREAFEIANHQIQTLQHGKAFSETLYAAALVTTKNPGDVEKAKASMRLAMQDQTLPEFFPAALQIAQQLGLTDAAQAPTDAAAQPPEAAAAAARAKLYQDSLDAQNRAKIAADAVKKTGQPLSAEATKIFIDAIELNGKIDVKALDTRKKELAEELLVGWTKEKEEQYLLARQNAMIAASKVSVQLTKISESIGADVPPEKIQEVVNQKLTDLAKTDPDVQRFLDARSQATAEGLQQIALQAETKIKTQMQTALVGNDVSTAAGQTAVFRKLTEMAKTDVDVKAYLEASGKAIGFAGREQYQGACERINILQNGKAICQTLYASALQGTGNPADLDKAKASMKLAMADEKFIVGFPPAREVAVSLGLSAAPKVDTDKYQKEVPGFKELLVAETIMEDTTLTRQQRMEKAKPLYDLAVAKATGDTKAYDLAVAEAGRKGIDLTAFNQDPEFRKGINIKQLDANLKDVGTLLKKIGVDKEVSKENPTKLAELNAQEEKLNTNANHLFVMRQQPIKAIASQASTLNSVAMDMYKLADAGAANKAELLTAANEYQRQAAALYRSIEKLDPKGWNKTPGFAGAAKLCDEHKLVDETSAVVVGEVLIAKKAIDFGLKGPLPAAEGIWGMMNYSAELLKAPGEVPVVGKVIGFVPDLFAEGVSNTGRGREGAAAALFEAMTKDEQLAMNQVQGIQHNMLNQGSYIVNDLLSAQTGLLIGKFVVQAAGTRLGPWGKGLTYATTAVGSAYGTNALLDQGSASLLGTDARGGRELATRTLASVAIAGALTIRGNHIAANEAALLSGGPKVPFGTSMGSLWNKPVLATIPGTPLQIAAEGGAVSKLAGVNVSPHLAREVAALTPKGQAALEAGLAKIGPDAFSKMTYLQQLQRSAELMKAATKAEQAQVAGGSFVGKYMPGSGNWAQAQANLGVISSPGGAGILTRSWVGAGSMAVYGVGEKNWLLDNPATGKPYTTAEIAQHAGYSALWGGGASAVAPLVGKTLGFIAVGPIKHMVVNPIKFAFNSEAKVLSAWGGVAPKVSAPLKLSGLWKIGGEGAVGAYAGRAGIGFTGGGVTGFALHNPAMVNRELAKQEKEAGLAPSGQKYTWGESLGYGFDWGAKTAVVTTLAPVGLKALHGVGNTVVRPVYNTIGVPIVNYTARPVYNTAIWAANSGFNTTNLFKSPLTAAAGRGVVGYGGGWTAGTAAGLVEHGASTPEGRAKAYAQGRDWGTKAGVGLVLAPFAIKVVQVGVDKAVAPLTTAVVDRLGKTAAAKVVSDGSAKYAATMLTPLALIEQRAVADLYGATVEIPRVVKMATEALDKRKAFLKLSPAEQAEIIAKEKKAQAAAQKAAKPH